MTLGDDRLLNFCENKNFFRISKQEVGDDLSICVLNLEFVELKSCFIRNAFF